MSRLARSAAPRPRREDLLSLVHRLDQARVCVAGDAVLDAFEFGEIARVSREAPVLILDHRATHLVPGGAANTAANLAALEVRVALVGRVGRDDQGAALRDLLAVRGVEVAHLLADRSYATPTKTRILAGSPHTAKQQIVRIDRGRRGVPLGEALRARLLSRAARFRQAGWAVLLADYGYGQIGPDWVADLGPGPGPLTVDSRFQLAAFRGVQAATPNLEEVEGALHRPLGDDDEAAIGAAAAALRRRLKARALLVTRGSRGMTLAEEGRAAVGIPVFGSDEVADVTGAGDTVIATFTAARAAGAGWRAAAELANIAGGLVVMKRGTATVTRAELRQALQDQWSD